jgi:hypothetical protein
MPLPLGLLLPGLLGIGEKIIDRVIPDPEAAEAAKAQFAREAAKMDQEELQSFQDFIVAYEGSGNEVHPVIQILRGSVRPVLTYCLAGAFVYGFVRPDVIDQETMTLLFQLNLLSLGFWFGERALRNLGLNFQRNNAGTTDNRD